MNMRYLTLIRHAKAEDPAGFGDDRKRPLTERGFKDAKGTARLVENLQPAVDWWIVSPATRARETASTIFDVLGIDPAVRYEGDAYPGPAEKLLGLVAQAPPDRLHVLLVGHNPGLEEMVAGLCASNSLHLNFRMPTASLAHLELEISHWEQVRWGCGSLRLLVAPKLVKKP
jgi:phosphohistidine phosphatase